MFMEPKREENPCCQTYGFGQTGVQTPASRVSNAMPAGTALHLLVDCSVCSMQGGKG